MKIEKLKDETLLKKMKELEFRVYEQAQLTCQGAYTAAGELRCQIVTMERTWWKYFTELRNRDLWALHCKRVEADLFYSFGDLLA
jgi:hypothetical protein